MAALTNTAANRTLNWIFGGTPTAPTTPLQVALVTALGDATTPGTEVTGGDYTRQNLTASNAVDGQITNTTDLIWENMPECTIVGWEVWDSAEPPIRQVHQAVDNPRNLQDGDDTRFTAGTITCTLA